MTTVDMVSIDENVRDIADHLSQVGVWILDLTTGECAWSNEMYELLEADRAHHASSLDALKMLVHPDDAEKLRAANSFIRSHKDGDEQTVEYRLTRAEGTIRHVVDRRRIVRDKAGRLVAIGTLTDITSRVEAEHRANQQLWIQAHVVDEVEEMVALLGPNGKVLSWNRSAEHLLGYSEQEALGQPISFIHPKHQHGRVAEILGEALAASSVSMELELLHKNGTMLWAEVRASPVRDPTGDIIGVVSCAVDISERKHAENSLHQAEERTRVQLAELSRLYNALPFGVCLLDRELRYVRVNQEMARFNGLAVADHLGRTPNEVAPDVAKHVEPLYRRVLDEGQPLVGFELSMATPADDWVVKEWRVSSYPDHGPTGVEGITAIVQDVSDLRRREREMRQALIERDVLLREVHHRVKNNLQIVSSLLSLQAVDSNEETSAVLAASSSRIQAMALVHDMLMQDETRSSLELSQYLRSLVGLVASTGANAQVNIRTPDEPVYSEIDQAIPCGLVTIELLSNALHHARTSGVLEIAVELRCRHEMLMISVSDNGCGLPDGFDLRTSSSLGLQIAQRLSNQLDGRLSLENTTSGALAILQFVRPFCT
jgi:PAS domain S-box-containing protein